MSRIVPVAFFKYTGSALPSRCSFLRSKALDVMFVLATDLSLLTFSVPDRRQRLARRISDSDQDVNGQSAVNQVGKIISEARHHFPSTLLFFEQERSTFSGSQTILLREICHDAKKFHDARRFEGQRVGQSPVEQGEETFRSENQKTPL